MLQFPALLALLALLAVLVRWVQRGFRGHIDILGAGGHPGGRALASALGATSNAPAVPTFRRQGRRLTRTISTEQCGLEGAHQSRRRQRRRRRGVIDARRYGHPAGRSVP